MQTKLMVFLAFIVLVATPAKSSSEYQIFKYDFDGDGIEDILLQTKKNETAVPVSVSPFILVPLQVRPKPTLFLKGKANGGLAFHKVINGDFLNFDGDSGSDHLIIEDSRDYFLNLATIVPADRKSPSFDTSNESARHVSSLSSTSIQKYMEQTDQVGRLAGDITVTNTGQVSYLVPLKLPPVGNELSPQLTLQYNSALQRTAVGFGWSIGGIGGITRCTQTLAHEGVFKNPILDTDDRFCLNGAKLVAINGVYGSNKTEYRTLVDEYSRIVSLGRLGQGPEKFIVYKKSGQIFEYGSTTDSRLQDSETQSVLTWGLSQVYDRHGNHISYVYNKEEGKSELNIEQIAFGGNSSGVDHYRFVDFDYDDHNWPLERFRFGQKVADTKQLRKITIRVKNLSEAMNLTSDLWSYEITHEHDQVKKASLLKSIQLCSKDTCLPSTNFSYLGEIGDLSMEQKEIDLEFVSSKGWLPGSYSNVQLDINQDGFGDHIFYRKRKFQIRKGSKNGLKPIETLDNPIFNSWSPTSSAVIFSDLDQNGYSDIVHFSQNAVMIAFGDESGWPKLKLVDQSYLSMANAGSNSSTRFVQDLNRDGYPDILALNQRRAYIRYGTGNQEEPFLPPVQTISDFSISRLPLRHFKELIDVNADGYSDLIGIINNRIKISFGSNKGFSPIQTLDTAMGSSNWLSRSKTEVGDVNGDGLPDLLMYSSLGVSVAVNTGKGFLPPRLWLELYKDLPNFAFSKGFTFSTDINQDGISDFLTVVGSNLYVVLNTGSAASNHSSLVFPLPRGPWRPDRDQVSVSDIDDNGSIDIFLLRGGSNVAMTFQNSDLRLRQVTDGFGYTTKISWTRQNQSHYETTSKETYPLRTIIGPGRIVSQVEKSNGLGGFRRVSYAYKDAVMNLQGLGFLGYKVFSETDHISGIRVEKTFSHDTKSMTAGLVTRSQSFLTADRYQNYLVSETESRYDSRESDGVYQVSLESTKTTSYSLHPTSSVNSITSENWLSEKHTSYQVDAFGNNTQISFLTSDGYGNYRQITTHEYKNDLDNWILGKLLSTTNSFGGHGDAGVADTVRSARFSYTALGDLETETTLYDDEDYLVTKTERNNSFGHVSKVTRIPSDKSGLSDEPLVKKNSFDEFGFLRQQSNEKGHLSHFFYDPSLGQLVKSVDANGATTELLFSSFGHDIQTKTNIGLKQLTLSGYCQKPQEITLDSPEYRVPGEEFCPSSAIYFTYRAADNEVKSWSFYDLLEREIRNVTELSDSQYVVVDTLYNVIGKVSETTEPYIWNSENLEPKPRTLFKYDFMGRIEKIVRADGSQESYQYDGMNVTLVDANNHKTKRVLNALGKTVMTENHLGQKIKFYYDNAGQVIRTEDPNNNTIRYEYDALGRRIKMIDPDAGTTTYSFNSLGYNYGIGFEDGSQVERTFDSLGRIIKKVEKSSSGLIETSMFVFDSSPNGVGLIHKYSKDKIASEYFYDSLSRLVRTKDWIEDSKERQLYETSFTYDSLSRVKKTTFASGLEIVNRYNQFGRLVSFYDNDSKKEYWHAGQVNQYGKLLSEYLGNGLKNSYTYSPEIGRLLSIESTEGVTKAQHLEFTYDLLGNVVSRSDRISGHYESYQYDTLNRLVQARSNKHNNERVTYDTIGNIETRTIGSEHVSYRYDQSCGGPHAVCQTTSSTGKIDRYEYSRGGHQVSGRGRLTTFNVDGKPMTISLGSNKVLFRYDAKGIRRVRENINGDGSVRTHYISKVHEVMIDGEKRQHKHFIGDVVISIEERKKSHRYLHRDHLGSIVAISSESGSIVENIDFDSWGKKRSKPSGHARAYAPFSSIDRGFTNHEHLDEVELIHMGGRAYDPVIGRFISPDPIIQDSANLQSYNRYTYVWNNPLTRVDPTGYFSVGALSKAAGSFFAGVGKAFLGNSMYGRLDNWLLRNERSIYATAINVAVAISTQGMGNGYLKAAMVAAGGFTSGYVASDGDIDAASRGAITSLAFFGVGEAFEKGGYLAGELSVEAHFVGKVTAHGLVGGLSSQSQGGRFASGFFSSAVNEGAAMIMGESGLPSMTENENGKLALSTLQGGLIGGTSSEISGGSFETGFVNATYAQLFNLGMHSERIIDLFGLYTTEEVLELNQISRDAQTEAGLMQLEGLLLVSDLYVAKGLVSYGVRRILTKYGAKSLTRQAYKTEVTSLKSLIPDLKRAGLNSEQIAKTLHGARRALGVKYKNLTPSDMLQKIYQRNIQKYGDKLGPSIDFLRSRGKTWDQIIESATRTGGKDLGL